MDTSPTDETVSIMSNVGETVLDSFLTDGIFRDIPILGTGISLIKIGSSISDRILIHKLKLFLEKLDLKSETEIEEFKNKYLNTDNYKKIGSKLILYLNSADDEKKIAWISKALKAFVDKKINQEQFSRLTMIINNSFPAYLEKIDYFRTNDSITSINPVIKEYVLEHLYSLGCLSDRGIDGGINLDMGTIDMNSGKIFQISEFGKLFLQHIL